MTINIKYRSLKAFDLVVSTHSFTHASDHLGVTQPSMTALIQDLEHVLGVRLFERTTRQVTLTQAGEDFHKRIQRPLADLEEAYRAMGDIAAAKRGMIVVGALPSMSLTLVPPTLGELRRSHPGLQTRVIEAHNDDLISMVRDNQVDFALATLLDPPSDLKFDPLLPDSFFAVYTPRHPIALLKELRWKDLVQHDLILLSQGSSARSLFDRANLANEKHGLRYDVTHMTTAVNLVRQGLGVTLLPRLALPALRLEGLKYRAVDDDNAQRTLGVVRRKDRHPSPASQAFTDQITHVAQQIETSLPSMSAQRR